MLIKIPKSFKSKSLSHFHINITKIFGLIICVMPSHHYMPLWHLQVLSKSTDERVRILEQTAKYIRTWIIRVKKTKAIYHTMNMFAGEGKHYIAEGWCACEFKPLVQDALRKASVRLYITSKLLGSKCSLWTCAMEFGTQFWSFSNDYLAIFTCTYLVIFEPQ